jgi:carotenoid cleavage dioxygenase
MPRNGTAEQLRWFDVEPCYVYHPFNAYDDGDRIILDVARHPKMFATDHQGPNEGPPTFDRWTVDLSAGKVLEERRDDHGQEFPRIDERLVGRRHRYGYAVGFEHGIDAQSSQSLIKHDTASGTSITRHFGDHHEPGEFVFVPSRPGAGEDEGVVMGFVYDGDTDRSNLTILDAGTLDPVAAVHLPVRVPHGFHGNWIASR